MALRCLVNQMYSSTHLAAYTFPRALEYSRHSGTCPLACQFLEPLHGDQVDRKLTCTCFNFPLERRTLLLVLDGTESAARPTFRCHLVHLILGTSTGLHWKHLSPPPSPLQMARAHVPIALTSHRAWWYKPCNAALGIVPCPPARSSPHHEA